MRWLALGILILVLSFVLSFLLLYRWAEGNCAERGGHLYGVGRGRLCLSDDGRVLER
jgi:hypothetical protein